MPQGSGYLNKKSKSQIKNNSFIKNKKDKKVYNHKKSAAKFTKKGNPTVEIRRGCGNFKKCGNKSVTAMINRNIEEIMASKVLQTGSDIKLSDVKSSGKDRLKEINRNALKKKKSKIVEHLENIQKAKKDEEDDRNVD